MGFLCLDAQQHKKKVIPWRDPNLKMLIPIHIYNQGSGYGTCY